MIVVLIVALFIMALALAQLADAGRQHRHHEDDDVWLSQDRPERRWR